MKKLFLSMFGTGYAPFAPGTFGSLATLPLVFALSFCPYPLFVTLALVIVGTIFTSIWTEQIQNEEGLHDPQWIVIDECLGMLTAWCFYLGNDIKSLLVIFLLFRFFDIIKFWPASYFDKKMQHGAGVILDDIVSGLYAGLLFLALKKVFLFS